MSSFSQLLFHNRFGLCVAVLAFSACSIFAGGGTNSAAAFSPLAAGFDHQHRAWGKVLRSFVTSGRVDYAALKAQPSELRAYLAQAGAVTEREFKRWSTNQQMAFLINVYNAATLQLIVDHYPAKSIKQIGGWLGSPWNMKVVRLFEGVTTLGYVEHELLRPRYAEPRVHFALVCAAIGCPELRADPYVPERLQEQLDEQGRGFVGDTNKNRFDSRTRVLGVSPIFKWYADDFEAASGSVPAFVARYFDEPARSELIKGRVKVRYTRYDWSLNDQSKQGPSP